MKKAREESEAYTVIAARYRNMEINDEEFMNAKRPSSAFELRGTSIHDAKKGKLICTIWPERRASDEREEGESWLAMHQRTKPEREAIERHTEQRAASVCAFLNSQNS